MTPRPLVLGIDPGATTAAVARIGDLYHDHALIKLDLEGPPGAWLDLADACLTDLVAHVDPDVIAVEGVTAPRGHANGRPGHIIDPAPLIATAHLVGAIYALFDTPARQVVIVPPGGHGSPIAPGTPPRAARQILERLYPPELIGPRETTGTGKGPNQHLRAAWDVAGVALHPTLRR